MTLNIARQRLYTLTTRQRSVMEGLALGLTIKEVAGKLCVSPKTIECHLAAVYYKLGFRGIANLTRFAIVTHAVPVLPP